MATRKTLDFLPSVFKSNTNKKFLHATLDQLVSEPNYKRLDGYIGRKFSPTFKAGDNYIVEPTTARANYQLEPSVTIKNISNTIDFYSDYSDLVSKIGYYGGVTDNHSRLFSSEYYNYDPKIDLDKLINFSQYYWLPTFPDSVPLTSVAEIPNSTPLIRTINITTTGSINLTRGYTYQLNVVGSFGNSWIQTEPGINGTKQYLPEVSSRRIHGVTNNGTATITFTVPASNVQDYYYNLPLINYIDYAISDTFTSIDGNLLGDIIQFDSDTDFPIGKYIIFLNSSTSDADWTTSTSTIVPIDDRYDIWQINIDDSEIVTLTKVRDFPMGNRVRINDGETQGGYEFFKNSSGTITLSPDITAPLSTLYLQNASNIAQTKTINIIDAAQVVNSYGPININTGIIGQLAYTSPNGVVFTNGLRISFDNTVIPLSYWSDDPATLPVVPKTYIVEGVGTGISLVNVDTLLAVEILPDDSNVPFDIMNYDVGNYDEPIQSSLTPDYIVINRACTDLNAWSRSNRWFHIDTITTTADYLGKIPMFDQYQRANRPIIEFDQDLQLFNNGRVSLPNVDLFDEVITNASTQVNNVSVHVLAVLGLVVEEFQTIIFSNDISSSVRRQIYEIQYTDQSGATFFDSTDEGVTGEIITTAGSFIVTGIGTNFLTEFEKGAHLYTNTGYDQTSNDTDSFDTPRVDYIGKVKRIYSNTRLHIEQVAPASEDAITFAFNHPRVALVATALPIAYKYSTVLALSGTNAKTTHWYNSLTNDPTVGFWQKSQIKIKINQPPLFDVIDANDISLGDKNTYVNSTFGGTRIFSFLEGTGTLDPILNLPLSYTSVGNSIGDINFKNNFDNEDFTYTVNKSNLTFPISNGFLRQNLFTDLVKFNAFNYTQYSDKIVWTTILEKSKQYQLINHTYTGATNYFEYDVLAVSSAYVPNFKVFVNNQLTTTNFSKISVGVKNTVKFNAGYLTIGDTIDILIYGEPVSNLGYYQIPTNLDANSKNISLSEVTLGQMRNHLLHISQNTLLAEGQTLKNSYYRNRNGSIIQNSAPVMYSSLFLIDSNLNFINAIDLARREYTKFKNKFLELCVTLPDLNPANPVEGVDAVVSIINAVKNGSFSWYYSDMLPSGDNYTTLSYDIANIDITDHLYSTVYALPSLYSITELSNRAIIVYYNGQQLMVNRDYTFDLVVASLKITDAVELELHGTLEIREYTSTDGNCVPETPTKLGLYPKYMPEIFMDNTYQTEIEVIQGHDGSLTPAFGDLRDAYLLELERRIYNNIKAEYKTELIDIASYTPGKFRTTEYSLTEFNSVLNSEFLKWIGGNKVDYSINSYFQPNNEFSWNYNRCLDIDGQPMIGYWRGIYKYFYDTDRPHTHPWEMLGFSEKPSGWEARYGAAPYTSVLLNLWLDLEDGYNYVTGLTNPLYARPGLSKILPVDVNGDLVSPTIFLSKFDSATLNYTYAIGDQGPVESAWRRTSEFAYAMQRAIALLKPAIYFGTLVDTSRYTPRVNIGQFTVNSTNKKVTPTSIVINGESVNGNITRASGYINWVSDYITSFGMIGPTKVRTYLSTLDVKLSHKMAGFTDKKYITVLADQYSPNSTNESTIIPDENYMVHLNKSVPIKRINYSAVIVEKTDSGYTVSGYNLKTPYFTIIPSQSTGSSYVIQVLNTRGVIYKDYQNKKITVPYGHEFKNKQQIVDFLVSYQRILIAQGFVFENYNSDLGKTQDWVLAAEEFLTWTLQGWKSGNILVLSPVGSELTFTSTDSVVDMIGNRPNESRILNPNFEVIKNTALDIVRDSSITTINAIYGQTIAFAEITLVQYDHALIFDNVTVFNDVIYKPELGNRQHRLRITGSKTSNWNGELSPAGFIYTNSVTTSWSPTTDYKKGDIVSYKTISYTALQDMVAADVFDFNYWSQLDRALTSGLLPNFSNNALKIADIYNIDTQPLDENFDTFSNGLIGYRSRSYLEDIGMSQTTQSKFYQGYIREKGTQNAISALAKGQFNKQTTNLITLEEWAMRVGEYGAIDSNQSISVRLDETKYKANPSSLSLLGKHDTSVDLVNIVRPLNLLNSPLKYEPSVFLNRESTLYYENDVKSAGYVNINDVDALLFDMNKYATLSAILPNIVTGYRIWVAKDFNDDWQVYRVTEVPHTVTKLEYALDNKITVTMSAAHGLAVRDIFAFRGLDANFDNFYQVLVVESTTSVIVAIDSTLVNLVRRNPIEGSGDLFDLTKMRYSTINQVTSSPPKHGWKIGDMAWVDKNQDGQWEAIVYNPTNSTLPKRATSSNSI